jgi:hypothetical protein
LVATLSTAAVKRRGFLVVAAGFVASLTAKLSTHRCLAASTPTCVTLICTGVADTTSAVGSDRVATD